MTDKMFLNLMNFFNLHLRFCYNQTISGISHKILVRIFVGIQSSYCWNLTRLSSVLCWCLCNTFFNLEMPLHTNSVQIRILCLVQLANRLWFYIFYWFLILISYIAQLNVFFFLSFFLNSQLSFKSLKAKENWHFQSTCNARLIL